MAELVITPRDRLGFTLFAAASLHAAVILGISFSTDQLSNPSPTIEVTLSTHNDEVAPEDADFIAQTNQLGSGTEAEVLEKTTQEEAELFANEFQEVMPDPVAAVEETKLQKNELLTAAADMPDQVTADAVEAQEQQESTALTSNLSRETLAREIASLEARIAKEQQALAKAPRVKRLTSVSTKSAAEAGYLNMWRRKVERIGNANYPSSDVDGSLRMLVIIREDGTLKEVRILDSSGQKVLDDAALRIVRLAAPYQGFSVDMSKDYDQLEIIRTWQFSQSGAKLGS